MIKHKKTWLKIHLVVFCHAHICWEPSPSVVVMKALAYSEILHIRVLRVNNVTQKSSKHFPDSLFKIMYISLLHGKFWYLHCIIFGLQSVLYTKTASDTSLRIKYNALIALVVQNSGSYYCGRWWALPYSNPIKILSTCSSLHGLAYMCSRQNRNSLSVLNIELFEQSTILASS